MQRLGDRDQDNLTPQIKRGLFLIQLADGVTEKALATLHAAQGVEIAETFQLGQSTFSYLRLTHHGDGPEPTSEDTERAIRAYLDSGLVKTARSMSLSTDIEQPA